MVSLVVILVGFISFNVMPTTPADPTDPASPVAWEEGSYDNPAPVCDDSTIKQEVGVKITSDDEEDEETTAREDEERFRGLPGLPWTTGGGGGGESCVRHSTKM